MAMVSISVQDDVDVDRSCGIWSRCPLGNSYQVRQGDLLAAVGSPAGVVHSLDYGFVSYVVKSSPMVDQHCRILYSDILARCGMRYVFDQYGWRTGGLGARYHDR